MQRSVAPSHAANARTNASLPARLATSLHLCARVLLGLAAATTATLVAPAASAAEPATAKSIAIHIEGPGANTTRDDLVAIVPKELKIVSPAAFTKALRGAGQTRPIGNVIVSKGKRDKTLERVRKAARAAKADAVILGFVRVNKQKKKEVYLLYVDQIPGDLAVDEAVPLTGTGKERQKSLDALLGSTLAELAPPKGKTPEKGDGDKGSDDGKDGAGDGEKTDGDGEAKADADKPTAERTPHEAGSALASVEVGFELIGRWFDYSDPVTNNLRPYDVFGAPTLHAAAEIYPLAGTSIPVLKGLGLTLDFARAFGLDSAVEGGDPITTTYQRFSAGLRERIELGDSPAPILGISAGLRLLSFSFDAPAALADEIPDVSYVLLRGGLDLRLPVGPVAVLAGAEYLQPLSSGDVYERFKDASVAGVAGTVGVAAPIASGFEARLIGEYTRFFSSFKPEVGDAYVAGGALDHYLGARLAAAYVY